MLLSPRRDATQVTGFLFAELTVARRYVGNWYLSFYFLLFTFWQQNVPFMYHVLTRYITFLWAKKRADPKACPIG